MRMKCPACYTKLVAGKPELYQTLNEHVADPNGECPPRPTYRCPGATWRRAYCPMVGFWDPDGDYYYGFVCRIPEHTEALGSMQAEIRTELAEQQRMANVWHRRLRQSLVMRWIRVRVRLWGPVYARRPWYRPRLGGA